MYAQLKHRHLEPAVHPNRRRDRMRVARYHHQDFQWQRRHPVNHAFGGHRAVHQHEALNNCQHGDCRYRCQSVRAGCGGHVLPNSTPNASDTSCLVYDQRFQQISNTLFTNVATCAAGNAGTICTSDANCTGGTICGPPDLTGTQMCTCGFDVTLSTLSAHGFNFIAQVPGDNKPHHVKATWKLTGVNQTIGSSNVAACVGPADVTVTQTKIFNNSGSSLSF